MSGTLEGLVAALATICTMFLSTLACGQDIAFVNAHIYTAGRDGEIKNATLVIRNGKFASTGFGKDLPAGLPVIDAQGKVITPGLFATGTPLGAADVLIARQLNDTTTESRTLSAGFDIRYGIDFRSPSIARARAEGVTRAIVAPSLSALTGRLSVAEDTRIDKIFAGSMAIISLASTAHSVEDSAAGVVVQMGESGAMAAGGGRSALMAVLHRQLAEARDYAQHRAHYRSMAANFTLPLPDLEALAPVVSGNVPLVARADSARDIQLALALAASEKVKLILLGAAEGWMVADEIAKTHVPVILDAKENVASSFDLIGATLENAARLVKAGVLIAIWPEDGNIDWPVRTPRFMAGIAVANGLPYEQALAAITINPARIFGLDKRLGSIEPGKEADLVLWNGDPMETSTLPVMVFIQGVEQPLTTRDELLVRKYVPKARAVTVQ